MKENSRRNFIRNTSLATGALTLGGPLAASNLTNLKESSRSIHAFTKCLQFLNYNEMAELLAKLGFNGADLTVRPNGQISPKDVKKDLPRAFQALRKAGIGTDMIVTGINAPNHPDTKAILETMAAIGIRHYRMGYLSYDSKKNMPENLDAHKRTFEKMAKLNRAYGVTGNYQNHAGSNVGGPVWDLYTLLKDCDPKYIGVQYDIRHATVEGAMAWPVGIKLLAPWIRTTDIKDFYWAKNNEDKWIIKNVPLGKGMVDFGKYLEIYKALKIKGPISIHYEYDLGGAEHGKKITTMSQTKIEDFMKQDLYFLKDKLNKYGL